MQRDPFPDLEPPEVPARREPVLNVPGVVAALVGVLCLVHAGRALLTRDGDIILLAWTAFIPARYGAEDLGAVPGGVYADVWTFVSYALLHGDLTHLLVNVVWLLAFGSAVARRFGAVRFLGLFVTGAAAGALAHLVAFGGDFVPMIGASAAVSAYTAAAVRFMFQWGGPLHAASDPRLIGRGSYTLPAVPLLAALSDLRVLGFIAVWFVLNAAFGLFGAAGLADGAAIAWQAHVGGFLAGLFLFALFDPVKRPGRVTFPGA